MKLRLASAVQQVQGQPELHNKRWGFLAGYTLQKNMYLACTKPCSVVGL